ncbi:MAG: amino acid ABC transporter permease, partial [Cellulosilyticaceae bacterium]
RVLVGGIAFGINSGAYMAELIRGGIQAVDKGQMEAGRSLGLSYKQAMAYIVLPQGFRQMLPALVNEFIVLIKETAIIGFIGGMDLMKSANIMIANTYNYAIPLIMVAIIYLLMTGVFTKIMRKVEKKVNKGR